MRLPGEGRDDPGEDRDTSVGWGQLGEGTLGDSGSSRWELKPNIVCPSRSPRRHRSSSSSPARPKERRDEEKKELKDSKKERQITGKGEFSSWNTPRCPVGLDYPRTPQGFLRIPSSVFLNP